MKFNAGVILTDEEVRQLTEAGCEIYPMKLVDTDKHVYLRRDNDYVSVPAKYKSRLLGCGNFEMTERLRTDSPAGDGDSHNIVCSSCAQAHVSIHSCDFTNGYFQGQKIDRILLYRIPAVNSTPTNTARTELHSMITFHHANTRGSRAGRLRIAHLCVPETIVIHVSCLIPCRT